MPTQPMPTLRTAAANAARSRKRQNRFADELRRAGWIAAPPESVAALRAEADRLEDSADDHRDINELREITERERIREHAYGMRTALEMLTTATTK